MPRAHRLSWAHFGLTQFSIFTHTSCLHTCLLCYTLLISTPSYSARFPHTLLLHMYPVSCIRHPSSRFHHHTHSFLTQVFSHTPSSCSPPDSGTRFPHTLLPHRYPASCTLHPHVVSSFTRSIITYTPSSCVFPLLQSHSFILTHTPSHAQSFLTNTPSSDSLHPHTHHSILTNTFLTIHPHKHAVLTVSILTQLIPTHSPTLHTHPHTHVLT